MIATRLAAELVGLGAVLGLDSVTVGQAMLSRPLVSATLAGAVAGAVGPAATVGVLLECIALETLPVGASRYPEWGSAGVVAGAVAATLPTGAAGVVPLALCAGLVVAWLGGRSLVSLRHANGRRYAAVRPALGQGDSSALGQLMRLGLTLDLLRGALVTAVGMALVPLAAGASARWQPDTATTTMIAVAIAGMVAASAARQMFHVAAGARWFFAGALGAGTVLAAVQ